MVGVVRADVVRAADERRAIVVFTAHHLHVIIVAVCTNLAYAIHEMCQGVLELVRAAQLGLLGLLVVIYNPARMIGRV